MAVTCGRAVHVGAGGRVVTFTVIVQVEAPTAAFTPVPPTVIVPVPAVAVIVGVPPQPFTSAVGRADDDAGRQGVGEGEARPAPVRPPGS